MIIEWLSPLIMILESYMCDLSALIRSMIALMLIKFDEVDYEQY